MRMTFLRPVGLMALATTAIAQEDPSSASRGGVEEVVVTASRREENIQQAALSIQALSGAELARANFTKPEDLNVVAPGVSIGAGGNYPQVFIRGVGNYSSSARSEGAVAFNLDGVYISQGQAVRGMFFDLERIEVLKGPQGTLYGRNATGGAINVITAKPQLGEMSGFVEGQAGNFNLFQGTAALNLPLGDTVAFRIAGTAVDRDGYTSDDYNDEKYESGRLHMLWEPSSDISLLLSANYQNVHGQGAGSVLKPQLPGDDFRGGADPAVGAIFQAQPGVGPLLVRPNTDGYIDNTIKAVNAELNWDLGFATLTVLPAYRHSELRDKTYVPGFSVEASQLDKQSSLEARLGNSGETLKWVVGGFYYDQQQGTLDGQPLQRVFQGPVSLFAPVFSLDTEGYAAFGQATYSLTDRFRLTGGLRYTDEEKVDAEFLNVWGPPAPPSVPCPTGTTFDPATPTVPLFCRRDLSIGSTLNFNNADYKVGVEYDLAPQSMAYATIGTGFKTGGFSPAPPPNTFDAEKLRAFDVGVKNRFLDNSLQVNVEGFFWRYANKQESVLLPTSIPGYSSLITTNAGKAESYGADLDVLFLATPQDELSLKVQYNKTQYDEFTYPVFGTTEPATGCAYSPIAGGFEVDCSGKRLQRAPEWTGTAGYSHTFDLAGLGTLTASAVTQFSSSFELSTDYLGETQQESFVIGDLNLTYTSSGERWVVSAFVQNVTDELVYTQVVRSPFVTQANPLAHPDGLILGTVRAPRTYGGRLRYNF